MNTVDIDSLVVEFAQRWLHYGGAPDDEIYVTFGLTPTKFYERLRHLLTVSTGCLAPAETSALDEQCHHHLTRRPARTTTLM